MQQQRRSALNQLWHQNVHQPSVLQALTGYSSAQIYRHVPVLQENQQIVRKPGSGTTKKLSQALVQQIKQWLEDDPYLKCPKIKIRLHQQNLIEISASQLAKRLKQAGVKFRSQGQEPLLTDLHKLNRVQWCQDHLQHDWSNTIFSDESYFQLERNKLKIWCATKRNMPKRTKSPGLMIFGAISTRGPLPAIIDTKSVNSSSYCDMLEQVIFPSANSLFGPNIW